MRQIALILLFTLLALSILSVTLAQEKQPSLENSLATHSSLATQSSLTTQGLPEFLVSHPAQRLPASQNANAPTSVQIEPESITAVSAADSCESATELTVPGGGAAVVNSFTIDGADPDLACAWGTPSIPTGYRTAWYKFTAPNNGIASIDTTGSSYDTIVSVFTLKNTANSCSSLNNLQIVSCNDDARGFTSRNQFTVAKDTTYYIQVADWQSGVSGNADLLISLQLDPIDSLWSQQGSMTLARSRHATAIVDDDIYVIGGQTNDFDPFGGSAPTLTNQTDKYNTNNGAWSSLNDMPDVGLSNTTAVYVSSSNGANCTQGCIYLPGGYNGGATFDGTHWVFDIAISSWITKTSLGDSAGWPDATPFAWSAAVAHPDQTGYYVMGGLSSQPAITNTAVIHNKVFFYRTADNSWNSSPPDMIVPRYGHTAAYVGGEICVIGGITNGLQLLSSSECWNPAGGGSWQTRSALNIARYGAGSSVGPDGKWYVYGGSDGNHQAISTVEVYDPVNPIAGWVKLPVSYDLGASTGVLERSWPRGGFVNNDLWVIGGNATIASFPAIPTIERLFIGQETILLPLINSSGSTANDEHFGVAQPIGFNSAVTNSFDNLLDYYDVYTFDLTGPTAVTVKLTQIPLGSDYNFFIYSDNKQLWASGNNPSNLDESVSLTLNGGRYYLMVHRNAPSGLPNTANYRLIVEK